MVRTSYATRNGTVIWRHRSGSTLAQVMACCLTEPSHYPHQIWLLIRFYGIHTFTITARSPRGRWIKSAVKLHMRHCHRQLCIYSCLLEPGVTQCHTCICITKHICNLICMHTGMSMKYALFLSYLHKFLRRKISRRNIDNNILLWIKNPSRSGYNMANRLTAVRIIQAGYQHKNKSGC